MIIIKRSKKAAILLMAGTWMSIVEGFGGMRVKNNVLHFSPKIPKSGKPIPLKSILEVRF
jgi:trehalose/maltose hydrolase-like predicted phosphorylase